MLARAGSSACWLRTRCTRGAARGGERPGRRRDMGDRQRAAGRLRSAVSATFPDKLASSMDRLKREAAAGRRMLLAIPDQSAGSVSVGQERAVRVSARS